MKKVLTLKAYGHTNGKAITELHAREHPILSLVTGIEEFFNAVLIWNVLHLFYLKIFKDVVFIFIQKIKHGVDGISAAFVLKSCNKKKINNNNNKDSTLAMMVGRINALHGMMQPYRIRHASK